MSETTAVTVGMKIRDNALWNAISVEGLADNDS
jgi:hypothetical protein